MTDHDHQAEDIHPRGAAAEGDGLFTPELQSFLDGFAPKVTSTNRVASFRDYSLRIPYSYLRSILRALGHSTPATAIVESNARDGCLEIRWAEELWTEQVRAEGKED